MIERAALTLAGKIAPGYANLYMASGSALSLIEDAAKAIEEKDAEIAALLEQIKALEGMISGAIQHSWTPEDYDKFWLAVGGRKP